MARTFAVAQLPAYRTAPTPTVPDAVVAAVEATVAHARAAVPDAPRTRAALRQTVAIAEAGRLQLAHPQAWARGVARLPAGSVDGAGGYDLLEAAAQTRNVLGEEYGQDLVLGLFATLAYLTPTALVVWGWLAVVAPLLPDWASIVGGTALGWAALFAPLGALAWWARRTGSSALDAAR